MRLSNKVLATLGATWFGFMALSYYGAHNFLMKSFLDIEEQQIQKNLTRVQNAIDEVGNSLSTYTADWAHWNEAYEFVAGKNPSFVPKNFSISAFSNANINLIMYFDLQGKLLVGTAIDLVRLKLTRYPVGLEKYIYPNSLILKSPKTNQDFKGMISLPQGIMWIASSGVSYTDLSKPSNGILVVGRFLTPLMLHRLAVNTELKLTLLIPSTIDNDPSLNKIYQEVIQNKNGTFIQLVNDKKAYAYTLLRDINKNPIAMIRIASHRELYMTGYTAITYYLTAFIILGVVSAFLIGFLLRKLILTRLEYLNAEIRNIGKEADYTRRLNTEANDELSSVAEQFNALMGAIQNSHEKLEKQVYQLSVSQQNLANTNKKLTDEIAERKQAEAKIEALHSQLLFAARRAGMADIASGILHNIGNILNSLATSVTLAKERAKQSKAPQLQNIVKLIEEHPTLNAEMQKDAKGQCIPEYLTALSKVWIDDNHSILNEIVRLERNVEHIKDIVRMQQSMSTVIGLVEEINVVDLIEDALILNKNRYEPSGILIIREYEMNDKVIIDRVKLLQIVVNLIKNSIDSLSEVKGDDKFIRIHLFKMDDTYFVIEVSDNGIGIEKENITKIFNYGFTTKKKDGHGFGLHTSASAAQEMGGVLHAESEGNMKGAIFSLTLPISPLKKREKLYIKPQAKTQEQ